MSFRRLLPLLALAVSVAFGSFVFAKGKPDKTVSKGTPLTAAVSDTIGVGVSSDGLGLYEDGVGGVECYFGVSGKDADLVTYDSNRTLHFSFDPSSPAWDNSGLPSDFYAKSDYFGINYWGRYMEMGVGTTAQVQMDLEFKVGRLTYELDYQSLAVMRLTQTTWLITSDPGDIPGNPGFTASDQAALNVIRRRKQESFGAVNMPFSVLLTLK